MTFIGAVSLPVFVVLEAVAERGGTVYGSIGAFSGSVQGVAKATKEAVTSLPVLLLKDPAVVVNGTKNSKKLENGYPEPKRVLENGMKAAHDTAASAAAHAKAAHLPNDSKIAQMSSKPMAHVEAKG
ncbi:hypothetical protein WJX81_003465 [Elliptochloris bilobata]|uniref:Uncharacterized protein n=1 Tax=Elliptochloris bilobata TaxID=381761 RepID=A0AAW1SG79_9CHLO